MSRQHAPSGDASAPRRPLWRSVATWMFGLILALVVIVAVGWGVLSYVGTRKLEAQITRLRAAGQPLTFDEWERAQPAVAEADDAAPFYKAALALRRTSAHDIYDLTDWLKTASAHSLAAGDPSVAAIEQLLADNALALEMVDRGSARPQCAFDLGWSHGIGAMLPELSDARSLAKLLVLRTKHLVREHRGGNAAASLVSGLRTLRMFDRQPVLVTRLAKIACTALYVDAVEAVLEGGGLSDRDLARIESALAEADLSRGMDRVWAAERVYVLEIKRNIVGARGASLPDNIPLPQGACAGGFLEGPFVRLMIADLLRTHDRYLEAGRKDWPEVLDAVREVSRRDTGIFGQFSKILGPSQEKSYELLGRIIGVVRSAQVVVMIQRFRLAKKRLPGSLQELRALVGGDLPADPFTGGELVYKIEGKGFAVYSVGDDKLDDGGPEQAPKKDFGVTVRRAR